MKKLFYFLIILMMAMVASPAKSDTLVFELTDVIEGGDFVSGVMPPAWVTVTLEDNYDFGGGDVGVLLTLEATNILEYQWVEEVYLNFNGDLVSLDIISLDTSDVSSWVYYIAPDAFQATGDGCFDILFNFPPSTGPETEADFFTATEILTFKITSTDTLSVEDFNDVSVVGGGRGIYYAAAFIGSYNEVGASDDIGYIAADSATKVPEPGTLMLLGSGLIGVVIFRRKFKK